MNISKKKLRKHGLPETGYDGVEIVNREITGRSRWSVHYEIIFQWVDGKFYKAEYSDGATETQDESPWEYEDVIECTEMRQVERVVKVWEEK